MAAAKKKAKKGPEAGGARASRAPRARKTTPRAKPKQSADEHQRIRIRMRAYDHRILDASVRQIMDIAIRHDSEVAGPTPLPTEGRRYTVNRSPFIYKNAREQFEMRTHKRLIEILNPSPKMIDALTNISLPTGVSIEVKMM